MTSPFPIFSRSSQSIPVLVKHSIEPLLSIGTLLVVAIMANETIDNRYATLSLLVLAVTFPGEWPVTGISGFIRQVVTSWLILSVLLLTLGYGTGMIDVFPREVLLFWLMLVPVVVVTVCVILKKVVSRVKLNRARKKKAIIIGATPLAHRLVASIKNDNLSMMEIVGYFDDRDPPRLDLSDQIPLLGTMPNVAEYSKLNTIDSIYITLPMASQPRILRLLDTLRDTTASIYFLPDIFIHDLIQARMDIINGMPVLAVCETPFLGMNGLIKRVSDIILAMLILMLISPVMIVTAIGIKLSSPGPVLFRQRRYGLDGKEFIVYKFRSMTVCEDGPDVPQAIKNDSRITPFGAFIRKTSLDELPQLINVLQGSMSVVGPRPHAIAHNEQYRKLINGYMVRHKVKPGITGWAQVNGYRGETETLEKMEKRIEYDLNYLRNWSLYLDLWIIFRTAILVIKDRHAY